MGQDGLAAPYWLRRGFFLLLLEKPSRFLLRGWEVRITPRAPGAPGSSPLKGLFSTRTGPPTRARFPDLAAGGWLRPVALGARECDALWVPRGRPEASKPEAGQELRGSPFGERLSLEDKR